MLLELIVMFNNAMQGKAFATISGAPGSNNGIDFTVNLYQYLEDGSVELIRSTYADIGTRAYFNLYDLMYALSTGKRTLESVIEAERLKKEIDEMFND